MRRWEGGTPTASCDYNAYNGDFTHETPEMAHFGEYFGGSCDQKAYKAVFSHETLGGDLQKDSRPKLPPRLR